MPYEAARVQRNIRGESAEAPKTFDSIHQALAYVASTPVSKDGNRPWIRDTIDSNHRTAFLMVGGKITAPLLNASCDELRECVSMAGVDYMSDEELQLMVEHLLQLGYRDFIIPGPIIRQYSKTARELMPC